MRRVSLLFLLGTILLSGPLSPGPTSAAAPTAPPPTPVPPAGSLSPFPTALDTPPAPEPIPVLTAPWSALADLDTGRLLYQENARERRPIASLTKIMTALLVLESAEPRDVVTTSPAASQGGAVLGLEEGEEVEVLDLLYALLLQSANDAAVALAEHVSGSVEAFVALMNERAEGLGLRRTQLTSPNGLDDAGYSTARDLALLTAEAYSHPTFAEVVATKFHEIPAPGGPPRRIQNRNALLWLYPGSIGVKTGYTFAAGFCLAAAAERNGLRLAAVVLGAPEEAFSDAAELLDYGFTRFERRAVVTEGQIFDELEVGDAAVPVEADGTLELLVRRNQVVELRVIPEPGLSLPVIAGEPVGIVMAASEGETLGEVTLVAGATVESRPPADQEGDDRPWWERAWDAVVGFFRRVYRAIFD